MRKFRTNKCIDQIIYRTDKEEKEKKKLPKHIKYR